MLERLFLEVVQTRGVTGTRLFEQDGYVLFSSPPSAEGSSYSTFEECSTVLGENTTMTLVFEDGSVMMRKTPLGWLCVTASRTANLGAIRQSIAAIAWP